METIWRMRDRGAVKTKQRIRDIHVAKTKVAVRDILAVQTIRMVRDIESAQTMSHVQDRQWRANQKDGSRQFSCATHSRGSVTKSRTELYIRHR